MNPPSDRRWPNQQSSADEREGDAGLNSRRRPAKSCRGHGARARTRGAASRPRCQARAPYAGIETSGRTPERPNRLAEDAHCGATATESPGRTTVRMSNHSTRTLGRHTIESMTYPVMMPHPRIDRSSARTEARPLEWLECPSDFLVTSDDSFRLARPCRCEPDPAGLPARSLPGTRAGGYLRRADDIALMKLRSILPISASAVTVGASRYTAASLLRRFGRSGVHLAR
jgi:hypothetical protein